MTAPNKQTVLKYGDIELSNDVIEAVLSAESVLADYQTALEKGYVSEAKETVFRAADEIRKAQRDQGK